MTREAVRTGTRAAELERYRTMCLIRAFEERAVALSESGAIPGGIHPYIGQEAVAVGICSALRGDDVITSTHRGHGHVLAKGADPGRMLAELAGRSDGLNRGRGGTMHAADLSLGILGANAIVGAAAPIAVGAAWAARRKGTDRVAVTFFGDGGLTQGVVFEAMNLAAARKLPVLFVCENNVYALSLSVDEAVAGDPTARAATFGMAAETVDGMDVEAVHAAATAAVARARAGEGPTFLECRTYRFEGHHTFEAGVDLGYRTDAEVDEWRAIDPLEVQRGRLDPAGLAGINEEVARIVDEAVELALSSPPPDPGGALDDLYASDR